MSLNKETKPLIRWDIPIKVYDLATNFKSLSLKEKIETTWLKHMDSVLFVLFTWIRYFVLIMLETFAFT